MPYAWFGGCKINHYLPQYETASRAVLAKLGVGVKDLEFNCCGYPIRDQDFQAFMLTAAANLALADNAGLDIVTPCKCCFGNLRKAQYLMDRYPRLDSVVKKRLADMGVTLKGNPRIRHMLQVLDQDVGASAIKEQVSRPYQGLKIAVHYGCHALRPSVITQFDEHPLAPTIFERMVEVTGARSVDWKKKLECCGNPVMDKNPELAGALTAGKIDSARQAGADYLCAACTYCQIQFDQVQAREALPLENGEGLPSLLYPQLLGLSLGLAGNELGIAENQLDCSGVTDYLT